MSGKAVLSPKELALAIGVSESSLKRWADDGLVQVTRTAGGHRRIPISEAIRFIRASRATIVRPELLGIGEIAPVSPDVDVNRDSQRLTQMLEDGHSKEARALLLGLYFSGSTIAELCDGPLRAAMRHIGDLWQHSAEGIMIEHRATDTCLHALSQLRSIISPPEDAPLAIGGAPSGDPYILPSLVSAVVLMSCEFHAVNLGPNTPSEVLGRAAIKSRARLIWLSVSTTDRPGPLADEIGSMTEEVADHGIEVIVGGRATGDLPLGAYRNLHTATSMQQMVGLIDRLNLSSFSQSSASQNINLHAGH